MNKISKGKAIGLLSLGLASVALGSVGFAAWVVSGTTLPNDQNVTVTVGEIQDNRITVTAKVNESDPSVKLDADASLTPKGNLGISAAEGSTQDLTFAIDVNVKANDTSYAGGEQTFVFNTKLPDGTSDYVQLESIKEGSTALTDWKFKVAPTTGGVDKTFTFTLKWGSAFGNKNPVQLDKNSYDLQTVVDALKDLQTKMASGIVVSLASA